MDKSQMHTYDVELEVLTPVIINTGESYDFCELIPTGENVELYSNDRGYNPFPLTRFCLNDVSKMFEKMSVEEAKDFTDRTSDALSEKIPNSSVLRTLREERKKDMNLDQCPSVMVVGEVGKELSKKPMQRVDKVVQSPLNGYTYIPGSSIKGAIRTGLLEFLRDVQHKDYWSKVTNENVHWMKKKVPNQEKKRILDFEMEIMKNRKEFSILGDPFRYIKVSDFLFTDESDAIPYIAKIGETKPESASYYAFPKGRNGKNRPKMPIYSAMTNSFALSGRRIIARGTMSVDEKFFTEINSGGKIHSLQDILDKMGVFYQANLQSTLSRSAGPLMSYISNKKIRTVSEKDNFLRLGHYVGIKDYTFNINQVNPPKGHHKVEINKTGGRLITIANDILPGICKIRIISNE